MLLFAFLPLLLIAPSPAHAQAASAAPCATPEYRQLDFWVGDWDLTWPGNKPGEVLHGRNTVRKTLDNCVIEEQFDGAEAIHLRGKSVSMFNRGQQKWQQTWVDNQGAYLDFTGEFSGGQMVLSRHARNPQGEEILQRMVFKNLSSDSLDWSWEVSKDSGKTWTVLWPIHYVRRAVK